MGSHAPLETLPRNVFGLAPAYGHVPSPAERRAQRREKAKVALRSVGEGLLLVATVAAWAFVVTRR